MLGSSLRPYRDVQALCIGSIFKLHCTAAGNEGRVQDVFEHVVNLRVCGQLLSVTTRHAGGSARFLMTCAERFAPYALEPGQLCMLQAQRVEFGPLLIFIDNAPLWSGVLDGNARGAASWETERRFQAILTRLRPHAGGGESARLAGLSEKEQVLQAVQSLIGLGQGLTPSGDDMLLGYIAVYNHLGEDAALRETLHEAVLHNLDRTTDLSAQILRDALCGHYHEYVQSLVAALCSDEAERLDVLLPRLLQLGARSGGDMACGMAAALRAIREHREAQGRKTKSRHSVHRI